MRSPTIITCGLTFGALCALAEQKQPGGGSPHAGFKNVVAFGDSITRGYAVPVGAGWVELLVATLKTDGGEGSIAVFNAGGNGNTSAEGLKRIEADVLAHMPGLVLVEFGGNDAVHDGRAVSVDEFERNLLTIREKVQSRGGDVVLVTFPPVINEWHSTRADTYYAKWGGIDQCVEEYRQRTRDVAKRLGCPLFDLDLFLRQRMAEQGREIFLNKDGVHLTPEANKQVAEAVRKFLTANR